MAVGAVMFVKPGLFYEMTESWKHSGGEPSRLWLFSTRFGGAMCTLAGIAGLALPLISKAF